MSPTLKTASPFFNFLEDSATTVPMLRAELSGAGVSLDSLERRVADIINRHKPVAAAPNWLAQARAMQKKFEARVQGKKTWISDQFKGTQELIAAIKSGDIGLGLQQQAQVYFRDQDLEKVCEQDLRSFLRDRELLADLAEDEETDGK